MTYQEVFKVKAEDVDPGEVFYTLTREDIGHTTIVTTAGPIYLNQVIGRVMDSDVGIRLYRIQTLGTKVSGWNWTAENRQQRDLRLRREKKLRKIEETHE